MHLWQGGEPQTTQASHIPLWLRPSDRKRQGAPQGLSAEDQSARVGGRLSRSCRGEQCSAAVSVLGGPKVPRRDPPHLHGPTPGPLSHSGPRQRVWEDGTMRQGGPNRSLLGVLPAWWNLPSPCFYLSPSPIPRACETVWEHPGASVDLSLKCRCREHKSQPDTSSQSSLAALRQGGHGSHPCISSQPTPTPAAQLMQEASGLVI